MMRKRKIRISTSLFEFAFYKLGIGFKSSCTKYTMSNLIGTIARLEDEREER